MEVTITDVNNSKVTIQSDIGCFTGTWCSSKAALCKKYIVELDYDGTIIPANIRVSNNKSFFIKENNNNIILNGVAEEVEDNILYLKINKDIIMFPFVFDVDYAKYINQCVEIVVPNINLYDMEVY